MEPARHERLAPNFAAPPSRPDSDGDTPGETPLSRLLAPPAAPPLELLYGIIGGEARARKCLAARGRAAYRVPTREEVAGYTIPMLTLVQTCRDPAAHLPGRNLAARNKFGVTLLHKSLRYPNWRTSSFMMAADASLALYKDDLGRIPLHDACWNETLDFDVIVQLLEFDWTALVCYDARGHTPLDEALRTGQEVATVMLRMRGGLAAGDPGYKEVQERGSKAGPSIRFARVDYSLGLRRLICEGECVFLIGGER